jgi:drug/metabolite transporter (DMT)-like permease
MKKWFLVGLIVGCNACADLMNTAGMRQHGEVNDLGPKGIAQLLRSLSRNRYVLGGILAMVFSFFALISLLSIAEVSFGVPATAASLLIETFLAKVLLHEQVHWQRWVGASLVVCGVALLDLP